ncbi:MAG TPA: hypothetical protein ENH82_13555 [bacterium]|nr:hypothetical protein [bacterium]
MAKDRTQISLWKLIIAIMMIVATTVAGFVWAQADIKAIDVKANSIIADAKDVEIEGCKPSQKNGRSIDLIEYRLDQIQTTQTTIQADTKEILKRLPK